MWLLSPHRWGWITSSTPVLPLLPLGKKKKSASRLSVWVKPISRAKWVCVYTKGVCYCFCLTMQEKQRKKETKIITFCTFGSAWKAINRNNRIEGVKHLRWRWTTCRKHLKSVGFPRWASGGRSAAADSNTKQHSTSFRWLIWLFRPRSSGSDARTGCELLIRVSTEY